jgi:hypothetical protein
MFAVRHTASGMWVVFERTPRALYVRPEHWATTFKTSQAANAALAASFLNNTQHACHQLSEITSKPQLTRFGIQFAQGHDDLF